MSSPSENISSASGQTKNIAMWSGPRNLSTAMMYCFAQRNDCSVVDEPYYAAYLKKTGIKHAMYQQIIAAGEIESSKVAEHCVGENQIQTVVYYQKHMTKHMLPSFNRDWVDQVCNVFLIRDPARVIASYHVKQEDPVLSDIGVQEQLEIFDRVSQKTGTAPVVVNSADILKSPEKMLAALCLAIGIDFQNSMLSWPEGPKSYDGVWAPHWYHSVWKSKGFAKPNDKIVKLPRHLESLLDEANQYYDKLKPYAISIEN